MLKIPVMQPWLGEEEVDAVARIIRSGWIAQGPEVQTFEREFRDVVGAVDAVAVSNCTSGLHLALIVAGVGPGDEVIVPSFSFIATTNSVLYAGATPVFADVEISTGNISASTIEQVASPRTRAVILVHQAGVPADIAGIARFCSSHGIFLIEDAACAIGSSYMGELIGKHSELVAFSFHPRKIVTTGEGGMIATGNQEFATRLRKLREHGMSISAVDRHSSNISQIEDYPETGYNYRMTDVQAAIGRVQLVKMRKMVARRRELAKIYSEHFSEIGGVYPVGDPSHGLTNFQSYWIRLDTELGVSRNELMIALEGAGISTRRGIMTAHRELSCARFHTTPLTTSEYLSDNSLILPLYHAMTESDQERVIEAFKSVLSA